MQRDVFQKFSEIIYRESGIVLPHEKCSLLSSRIQKRISALGLKNESQYLKIIELDVSGEELVYLIDAVSTNVTCFYREEAHFVALREIIRNLHNAGKNEIKIWCAAASSGEEPYTIAFEALEATNGKYPVKILATDICTEVLNKALAGIYSAEAVGKVPVQIREKYMSKGSSANNDSWKVNTDVMRQILFKKLNLVNFPYPLKGPLDIIFCRNVMIYFDLVTRQRIIGEFQRLLSPSGFLFLSHSENLLGISHAFHSIQPSVFQKLS